MLATVLNLPAHRYISLMGLFAEGSDAELALQPLTNLTIALEPLTFKSATLLKRSRLLLVRLWVALIDSTTATARRQTAGS